MCIYVLQCRQCYEEWSAYGVEVPMTLCSDGGWHQVVQCYVPYLSGIQIFGVDNARRTPSADCLANSALSECCDKLDVSRTDSIGQAKGESWSPLPTSSDANSSGGSAISSRTVSTASTDSDSENDESCCRQQRQQQEDRGMQHQYMVSRSSNGVQTRLDRDKRLQSIGSQMRGSVLRSNLGEPSKSSILFEFFEKDAPHNRVPFTDRIGELSNTVFPGLSTLSTRELHPSSWYAVAWYPLYRLPCVSSDPATTRDLQASFLTFHSLSAAPATGAPIPPQLSPGAMAGIAFRAEVLRQALLSRAMMTVFPQTNLSANNSCFPSAHRVEDLNSRISSGDHSSLYGATSLPKGESPHVAARNSLTAMPLSVTALQPFAFAPYKAVGRTWIDDFCLHHLHLPMIATASAWTDRRGVVLPDLEFFARHSASRREWLPKN